MAVFTKMQGNHHLQGNVQVYNASGSLFSTCFVMTIGALFRLVLLDMGSTGLDGFYSLGP